MHGFRLLNTLWFRRSTVALLAYTLALSSISAAKETSRKAENAKVVSDNAIELIHNIATTPATSIKLPHARTVLMQVTAYCPCEKCCGPNAHGITASRKGITY